jgi:hypothetical protein
VVIFQKITVNPTAMLSNFKFLGNKILLSKYFHIIVFSQALTTIKKQYNSQGHGQVV